MEPQGATVPFPLRREGDLRKVSDLEQRVQALDAAIARVQQTETRIQESEASLRRLTEACGKLLQGDVAVQRVEQLNDRLSQVVEETAKRIEKFEAGVGREWDALRELYEKPLQAFQEQALAIRRTSYEAAQAAALCKQIAEESFTALAARASASVPATTAESKPWSLDDVTRVHREVRSAQQRQSGQETADGAPGGEARFRGSTFNVESTPDLSWSSNRILRWGAVAVLLLIFAAIGIYSIQMRNRVGFLDSQMQNATARIATAEKQTVEARQLAQQQILEAQRTARYAQTVAEIVAAPDLRRIDLVGRAAAPAASAQALWSRTRGFHLSAYRMPPTPPGKVYQVWALTQGEPASLGVFEPDQEGHGDLLVDQALTIPRATAVIVSLEDSAGAGRPTGQIYLGPRPTLEE